MSAPTTMQAMVCNYLAERRRLGFELIPCGRLLMSFARHIDAQEYCGPLTIEIMAQWAKQDKWQRGDRATWARRLKQLRPFTRYLRQFEPRTEVPDEAIFGPLQERLTPHIYNEQEIVDLLAAARDLRPPDGLRPATYETLFGLIAAAGLRVSEAVHLLEADVDLKHGLLTVRKTKFAKSRQLPLHPSTVEGWVLTNDSANGYNVNASVSPNGCRCVKGSPMVFVPQCLPGSKRSLPGGVSGS